MSDKKRPRHASYKLQAREQRQFLARSRNAAYALLTPAQKLAKLDAALGVGVGADKQRTKLAALMVAGGGQ